MSDRMTQTAADSNSSRPGRLTRAQWLAAAGAGITLIAMPDHVLADTTVVGGSGSRTYQFFPAVAGTYTPESIDNVLNMLDTIEHLLITVSTTALSMGHLTLNAPSLQIAQSHLAANVYHSDFLESLGAHSLSATFSTLPATLTDGVTFMRSTELVSSVAVSAYMTAVREFAELGQPTLAKNAYQLGAVHAEHRADARTLLTVLGTMGKTPAANRAFETDYFVYVRDAYTFLEALGAIGSTPAPQVMTYPGRDAALAAAGAGMDAIIQHSPNNASVSTTIANGPRSVYAQRGDIP